MQSLCILDALATNLYKIYSQIDLGSSRSVEQSDPQDLVPAVSAFEQMVVLPSCDYSSRATHLLRDRIPGNTAIGEQGRIDLVTTLASGFSLLTLRSFWLHWWPEQGALANSKFET
jgi:hypothetical protein